MKRKITGYHQDANNDWVAELDCCHGQHVRHKPPFFNRPWVESQGGRDHMLGNELECVRCDRLEWPEGLMTCNRTPDFTEQTMAQTLPQDLAVKTGVWGKIHIVEGALVYVVQRPVAISFELNKNFCGIIAPGMEYSLITKDKVVFYLEFFTCPRSTADS